MAKSKRVKSSRQLISIPDWMRADDYVRTIGEMQRKIEKAGAEATAKIEAIKAKLAIDVKSDQDAITLFTESIEAFAVAHREELGTKQGRELNHGMIGWRKSTVISVKKTTLELLKKVFGGRARRYLHIKESPNKEIMAKLTDEQLAAVGARRQHKEVFFVEPNSTEAVDHGG